MHLILLVRLYTRWTTHAPALSVLVDTKMTLFPITIAHSTTAVVVKNTVATTFISSLVKDAIFTIGAPVASSVVGASTTSLNVLLHAIVLL